MAVFSLCPHMSEGVKELPVVFFIRVLIPFVRAPPLWPNYLLKAPPPNIITFSSVQFSHSVVSDSLRPHEPQHARPLCPSPTLRAFPNSCPLSQWCYPTISSSVVPFSFCPQSFPASGSFQMNQLFASGGQSIGVSALASVLPMNTQDWSPLGWTGWISLQSKGLSRVFSNTTVQKRQFFGAQLSLQSNCHIHTWPLEKPQTWLDGPSFAKLEVMISTFGLGGNIHVQSVAPGKKWIFHSLPLS